MTAEQYRQLFNDKALAALFPPERTDRFFDALFGDAAEGAYTISLHFGEYRPKTKELIFELRLNQRPGKCLACNLTHGLPEVFARHPVIDIKGVVAELDRLLDNERNCTGWRLGRTHSVSAKIFVIPLHVSLDG